MIPKHKVLKKMKQVSGNIIILHSTINEDHTMCYSRDLTRGRQNFLSFLTIFCRFTVALTIWKIKTLKNSKKYLEFYHFTHKHHKGQSYDVCFMETWGVMDRIFCHLGPFFTLPLPPPSTLPSSLTT